MALNNLVLEKKSKNIFAGLSPTRIGIAAIKAAANEVLQTIHATELPSNVAADGLPITQDGAALEHRVIAFVCLDGRLQHWAKTSCVIRYVQEEVDLALIEDARWVDLVEHVLDVPASRAHVAIEPYQFELDCEGARWTYNVDILVLWKPQKRTELSDGLHQLDLMLRGESVVQGEYHGLHYGLEVLAN